MQKKQVRIAEEKCKRNDVYREKQLNRKALIQEKQPQRSYELDYISVIACSGVAEE